MRLLRENSVNVKLLRKEGNNLILIEDNLSVMIQPDREDKSYTLWVGMLEGNHPIKKGDIIERQVEGDKFEVMRMIKQDAPGFRAKDNLLTELALKEYTHDNPQEPANNNTINNENKKIFIGHGGSGIWRELKDFIVDTLGLDYEEFNRISAVGKATSERLKEMLEGSSVAIIIMTGEDEHTDGSLRARENVIHEIGLFQGKLGFEQTIILLEDGCKDFSNIHGITHIPFPKGKINTTFGEIIRVLQRENIKGEPV